MRYAHPIVFAAPADGSWEVVEVLRHPGSPDASAVAAAFPDAAAYDSHPAKGLDQEWMAARFGEWQQTYPKESDQKEKAAA